MLVFIIKYLFPPSLTGLCFLWTVIPFYMLTNCKTHNNYATRHRFCTLWVYGTVQPTRTLLPFSFSTAVCDFLCQPRTHTFSDFAYRKALESPVSLFHDTPIQFSMNLWTGLGYRCLLGLTPSPWSPFPFPVTLLYHISENAKKYGFFAYTGVE